MHYLRLVRPKKISVTSVVVTYNKSIGAILRKKIDKIMRINRCENKVIKLREYSSNITTKSYENKKVMRRINL